MNKKSMKIWYSSPAPDNDEAWESLSLPLGNGYMGVRIFGGVKQERMQITETTLWTGNCKYIERHWSSGLENFAELYLDFPYSEDDVENYKRELCLDNGIARVTYSHNGVNYTRESFTSYPDKVFVTRISSDKKGAVSLAVRPYSPYNRDYLTEENDGHGRHGKTVADGNIVIQSGVSEYYNVEFEGQYLVRNIGGELKSENDKSGENGVISVKNADSVEIICAVGTNYVLRTETFTLPQKEKLAGALHPHKKVSEMIENAEKLSYSELRANHIADFSGYMDRVYVDLGGKEANVPTDVLKARYDSGEDKNPYLVELVYQMGRYVCLCSSREGTMPPHLQGIWSCFKIPPWTSGFWYNINIQMNYWHTFTSDLPEMFRVFEHFNRVRMKPMQNVATGLVKRILPENHTDGQGMDGWCVGTGNNPYSVSDVGGHTGPGVGGLTNALYWDYYDFTRDISILKNDVYPMLEGLTRFYCKFAERKSDGSFLCKISSSPEQHKDGVAYITVGCTFDQSMIYDNNKNFLKAAEILGDDPIVDKELVKTVKEQIDRYNSIEIGYSGQIKEYREEKRYGDIVDEVAHRHISHLVGVYPGNIVNSSTPHWQDGAKRAIQGRGPSMVGWAKAHRLSVLARIGDEKECRSLIDTAIRQNTYPNLMSCHNPQLCFQIDSCFGMTAAIAETIVQSHEGYISILPALPTGYDNGSVNGIAARGNFKLGFTWNDRKLKTLSVLSRAGEICKIKYPKISEASLYVNGKKLDFEVESNDIISFDTSKGETYEFKNIPEIYVTEYNGKLICDTVSDGSVKLSWTKGKNNVEYYVYRALESSPTYEIIAKTTHCEFTDTTRGKLQATYKIGAREGNMRESFGNAVTVVPFGVADDGENPKFGIGDGTFTHW